MCDVMTKRATDVCVIGAWHLGSVVSACLADKGFNVIGVDFDLDAIEKLNTGTPPIFEPDLANLVLKNIKRNKLRYTTNFQEALSNAECIFLAIDTTVTENDEIDLGPMYRVLEKSSRFINNNSLIIVSSQVPIGTCDNIIRRIHTLNPDITFNLVYNPENLRLGQSIVRFKHPKMIVLGSDNPLALNVAEQFFITFNAPIIRMDLKSAEMFKHVLNAFLATCISFINEIANIGDLIGVDTLEVSSALKYDERISEYAPLVPGLGFSGGTLARDLKILTSIGKDIAYDTKLLNAVLMRNKMQNNIVYNKLVDIFGTVNKLNVCIYGLTYKVGTSTLRRSVAIDIINTLISNGANVKAYDPKVDFEEIIKYKEFDFYDDPYKTIKNGDVLVIITEWPELNELDYDEIKLHMRKPIIIDTKNMLDQSKMIEKGYSYFGIGRGRKHADYLNAECGDIE